MKKKELNRKKGSERNGSAASLCFFCFPSYAATSPVSIAAIHFIHLPLSLNFETLWCRGQKPPTLMPADCSVLRTPTILPDSRISWDYYPTFMLLSGRVTRSFTHLWTSSCVLRPFDPGIILCLQLLSPFYIQENSAICAEGRQTYRPPMHTIKWYLSSKPILCSLVYLRKQKV